MAEAEDDFFEGKYKNETPPDIDGWYKPELGWDEKSKKGQIVQGKIVGLLEIEGRPDDDDDEPKKRKVVLVKLEKACKASIGEGKDAVNGDLKAGQVIAIGMRYNLRPILQYVEHRGDLKLRATEKEKLKGGRTMWHFDLGLAGKKEKPPQPVPASAKGGDSEIPF